MQRRRADVFFYGLFMDEELLRGKGLNPKNAEPASVDGLALRIGQRAALGLEEMRPKGHSLQKAVQSYARGRARLLCPISRSDVRSLGNVLCT